MSAETKTELETALMNHLQGEGVLHEGELISDYVIITSYLPVDRDQSRQTVYGVITPDRSMPHQSEGLAAWYLFRRNKGDNYG